MGAYSIAGRNTMLNAIAGTNPTAAISHAALFDSVTLPATTSVASTDIFTSTAHGLAAGDVVVFTAVAGGAGIRLGMPYFVIATNLAANTYSISETSGGAIHDHTTNVTSATVLKLVELTGGSPAYARKTIAFAAAAGGTMDDTTAPTFDVPAGATVDWCGYYSAVTGGTLNAVDDLTAETFAGQGTFQLSDVDLDLLAA